MININLYNNNFDYLILNKKEIDKLDLDYQSELLFYNTKKYKITHNRKKEKIDLEQIELKNDCINVICLNSISNYNVNINNWVDKYADTEFNIYFIINEVSERQIFFPNNEIEDLSLIDKISKTKNIKVLHHLINLNNKNFIFCPKLLFYGMINHIPTSIVYDYFYKYFPTIKKEYRIGYHINRLYDEIRIDILNSLIEANITSNKKLLCTINKNQKNTQYYDKKYENFLVKNNMMHIHGNLVERNEWYLCNLFDLSVKSDIELIYETNGLITIDNFYKNLTEKSIKPIMLGKPVIYIDYNTHNFIKSFGFKTYDILLSNSLDKLYNSSNLDYPNSSDWRSKNLYSKIVETVEYILKMNETDYNSLLNECKLIAEYNKNLFHKIMYEETIVNLLN
jgi:hypothetical protein